MSYANKLSSFELSFLLRATTAHAHPGDDPRLADATAAIIDRQFVAP
jgi:hypothetical protein